MIWNLFFTSWVCSVSPAFGCPRSLVVHLSVDLVVSRQVHGMNHCLQQTLSPSAHHLQSPGASLGQVLHCRCSTRWKVPLVSVTVQVWGLENLFLSCFKSLASLLWRKGKTSTLNQRGTCRSSSPSAVCCSLDCWGTWGSCWWCGSAPAALRQAEQTARLCESSWMSLWGGTQQHPAMTQINQALQQ